MLYMPGFKFQLLLLKQLLSDGASFWGSGNYLKVHNDRDDWYLVCQCKESVYTIKVKACMV